MSETVTISIFSCPACGAENRDRDRCHACDTPFREDAEDDGFSFTLSFAATSCPSCEALGPPGACGACDAEIPEPEEPSAIAVARARALAGLSARAAELLAGLEALPEPNIPVSGLQFATVLVDAGVASKAGGVIEATSRLRDLDFEDPKKIGAETRRAIGRHLDLVEDLHNTVRRQALFEPSDGVDTLEYLAALATKAARVLVHRLEIVTARTWTEAAVALKAMQAALNVPTEADTFGARLDELTARLRPEDVDERVALALGRSGRFTDDVGLIDLARVFAISGDEPSAFRALARGAGRYFAHLLDTPAELLPDEACVLALSAVPLATLDRPLPHHVLALDVRNLARRAHAQDAAAVQEAISVYDAEQGRVFASAMRSQRAFTRLALDEPSIVELVEIKVTLYRRCAETQFRASARLVLALLAVTERQSPPPEHPRLNDIADALAGRTDPACTALATAPDRALRNADAHEDFAVDPHTGELNLDGRRIDVDELDRALELLHGTSAAVDAAVACHRLDVGLPLNLPEWVAAGSQPDATRLLISALGAALGLEVRSIDSDADVAEIVVVGDRAGDAMKCLTLAVGSRGLLPSAASIAVRGPGDARWEVAAAAVDAWQGESDELRDLALLELLHDIATRGGRERQTSIADVIALGCALILVTDVPALVSNPSARHRRALYRRLRRLAGIATEHKAGSVPATRTVVAALRAAREAAKSSVHVPTRLAALQRPMATMAHYVETRNVRWPPL